MKYCTHCGNELLDEAIICPKCGCKVEQPKTVYKAPKELDVAKDELCPKGFFWPWTLCGTICAIFGFESLSFGIMYKDYLNDSMYGWAVTFAVIAIICFFPTIVITIIGSQKKWTHYSCGSKTYPLRLFAGYIFGPLGLICAIIGLVF